MRKTRVSSCKKDMSEDCLHYLDCATCGPTMMDYHTLRADRHECEEEIRHYQAKITNLETEVAHLRRQSIELEACSKLLEKIGRILQPVTHRELSEAE